MHTHTHKHICVPMDTCVCMCMWRPEINFWYHSSVARHLGYLRHDLSLAWHSLIRQGCWSVSPSNEPACFPRQMTSRCRHAYLLLCGLKLSTSCLQASMSPIERSPALFCFLNLSFLLTVSECRPGYGPHRIFTPTC